MEMRRPCTCPRQDTYSQKNQEGLKLLLLADFWDQCKQNEHSDMAK